MATEFEGSDKKLLSSLVVTLTPQGASFAKKLLKGATRTF